jgi:hypothetical protein
MAMVGAMAKLVEQTEDDLVLKARTQAEALSRLYEMYYERIFRFCVHRLFDKEIAEDVKFGDSDAPIFWYRPEGAETYRVIYGDLSVKDVEPENLPN